MAQKPVVEACHFAGGAADKTASYRPQSKQNIASVKGHACRLGDWGELGTCHGGTQQAACVIYTQLHGTQVIKALVVSNDTIKSLYVYVIIVAQGLRA